MEDILDIFRQLMFMWYSILDYSMIFVIYRFNLDACENRECVLEHKCRHSDISKAKFIRPVVLKSQLHYVRTCSCGFHSWYYNVVVAIVSVHLVSSRKSELFRCSFILCSSVSLCLVINGPRA